MRPLVIKTIASSILVLTACVNNTDPGTPLDVPRAYPTADYTKNTVSESATLESIDRLVDITERGRSAGQFLSAQELQDALHAIEPDIDPAFQSEIQSLVNDAVNAGGKVYDLTTAPSQNGVGGVYGGYLFNGLGFDIPEQIEKRLFTYVLYRRVLELMRGEVTPETVDKIVSLFGASPAFSNSDQSQLNPDKFVAKYAARRDKNDGTGAYTAMAKAMRTARAAALQGRSRDAELRAALADIRLLWEQALMATVVNYCYATMTTLSQTSVSEASRASAAHAFSEAAGIMIGWSGLAPSERVMTNTTMQEILGHMQLSVDQIAGTPTPYRVWTSPVSCLPRLEIATRLIQSTYGFTDAQMRDFRSNWVKLQGRQ